MARKLQKFHYIYKITNTKNGNYYIGMHSTDEMEDDYMGSGKRVRNSIRKHGLEVHIKEILEFHDNRESLREREKEIVNQNLLEDPKCMNLQTGGGGGFINEKHMKKCGSAGNQKMILLCEDPLYKEEFTKKCKSSETWKNLHTEGKFSYDNFKGKKHTEESKKMIGIKNSESQKGERNSQFGKIWIKNQKLDLDMKISKELLDDYLLSGWERGRIISKSFQKNVGTTETRPYILI
jgi:hypothetical protein